MAPDGGVDAQGRRCNKALQEWSTDPIVRRYQEFGRGYCARDRPSFIDHLFIKLPWHKEAEVMLQDVLSMASGARAEHCLKIVGGTRAGKTAFQRAMVRRYPASREKSGLRLPFGYMELAATPSPYTIDHAILRALGDPTWGNHRGPEARLGRIRDVAEQVGLVALGIDDLQHLVDTRGERVQHAAADRLKEIGFHLRVPFVFSGLHRMLRVFETNEQEQGRTEEAVEFSRLDWVRHKKLFATIAGAVNEAFIKELGRSEFDHCNDADLFRLYVSIGGLVGQLARVMRVAANECLRSRSGLTKIILRKAVLRVVAGPASWPHGYDPFHEKFVALVSEETLRTAQLIGAERGPPPANGRSVRGRRIPV